MGSWENFEGLTLFEALTLVGFTGVAGFADGFASLGAVVVLIGLFTLVALTTLGVFTGALFCGLAVGLGDSFADLIGVGFPVFFRATDGGIFAVPLRVLPFLDSTLLAIAGSRCLAIVEVVETPDLGSRI